LSIAHRDRHRSTGQPPSGDERIEALRRQRGPQTKRPGDRRLAGHGQPVLKALGLSRMKDLEPAAPITRYQRKRRAR